MSSQRRQTVPKGFLKPAKPKFDVKAMSTRQLQDHWRRNANVLVTAPNSPNATLMSRLQSEQKAIEARLLELVGVQEIQVMMQSMSVADGSNMEGPSSRAYIAPEESSTVSVKRRIIAGFSQSEETMYKNGSTTTTALGLQEAMDIESKAHQAEREKIQKERERGRKVMPSSSDALTYQEREERIWAFMNYKPTDSDLEDEDEDDEDDDPATWFDDDQDDGVKGQNIVDPDMPDDLAELIRVDHSRVPGYYPSSYS
ncbi:hypothetical protein SISNIDRAFT_200138 [Sistotremastrum niveocremeum HHB9708]|uniref:Uncharacterized protein n=2 Tax=Sistotremastraceae TaxID=3402574 RepID=A0A164ZP12_9AGAM|nr:hypothetical protein SISNIDRAFT_200138 [Sistotremastrum niveocremeum HHB9708]KZT43026.1 hypothetical protein SISSUDRAFT_802816 [Sistotremastrum suecicum HHB10207 ss-3]